MGVLVKTLGTHQGVAVQSATLGDSDFQVEILNYGAVTRAIRLQGQNLILGYEDWRDYLNDAYYVGAIVGRVANRTGNSRFTLAGRSYQLAANEGAHQLHGGPMGLSKQVWQMEADTAAQAVRLRLTSQDGDQGYPGAVAFEIVVRVSDQTLIYEMRGFPEIATPINLAQHNFYNLGGDLSAHDLRIAADQITPVDGEMIPDGSIVAVPEALDFQKRRAIGDQQSDFNFVLFQKDRAVELSGGFASLSLSTDQAGLQFYTGDGLGAPFPPRAGLCLEPQGFSNALNHAHFPSIIATPDAPYSQKLEITFTRS